MDRSVGVHIWHRCHGCGSNPIVGRRHECRTCPAGPDRDLCHSCYALLESGQVEHPKAGSYVEAIMETHRFWAYEGRAEDACRAWLDVESVDEPGPTVPDGFVVRPEFCSGPESSFGGHAFVASPGAGRRPVLLTALHVMDELIRTKGIDCSASNDCYTGRELPTVVTSVNLHDVFSPNWMLAHLGTAGPMRVLPDARLEDPEPVSWRDIAAFDVSDASRLLPVELGEAAPPVGDPVWLAAPCGNGSRSRRAVVVELTGKSFVFRFADLSEGTRYSSGAPLVDRHGRVVGINVGAGCFGGAKFGHGNHVGSVRRHLERAAA